MLNDKVVLVTGGTGFFGRCFLDTVLSRYRPTKLIVLSRDELKQHEMRQKHPDGRGSRVRYFIGDIRDRERLYRAFDGVDVVVHAAALKQVPACEYNPFEAVRTNIVGAQNIIDAALDRNVGKVLAISTDKAVNPVNLYGATKLCAEKLFADAGAYAGLRRTRFAASRYGNVVGSRGSVIPLFRAQRDSGKITVTDPRMTRFWITIQQGVDFVLSSLDQMQGGEVFVPKIPSTNILEIAQAVAPDCKLEEIGIRPGEKLHEVLMSADEARRAIEMEDRYVILPPQHWQGDRVEIAGKPVPEGFSYASDTNAEWLSPEMLRAYVDEVE